MGKAGKKPRKKMDSKQQYEEKSSKKSADRDWSFEDIVRSKTHRR